MTEDVKKNRIIPLLGLLLFVLIAFGAVFFLIQKKKSFFDLPSISTETAYIKPSGPGEIFVFFDENRNISVSQKKISSVKLDELLNALAQKYGKDAKVILFIDKDLKYSAVKPIISSIKASRLNQIGFAVFKQGSSLPMQIANFSFLCLIPADLHPKVQQNALNILLDKDKVYLAEKPMDLSRLQELVKTQNLLVEVTDETEFNDLVRFLGICLEQKIQEGTIYISK